MISLRHNLKYNTETYFLEIPSESFITVFSRPFFNWQAHPSLVAYTAPTMTELNCDLIKLNDFFVTTCGSSNPKLQRVIWFVLPDIDSIRKLNNCLDEFLYDHDDEVYKFMFNGIMLKYSTLRAFSELVPQTVSEKNEQTYFVFSGFERWELITRGVYLNTSSSVVQNKKGIVISGGNTSKRHLINHLTIRLHMFIFMINSFNENIIIKNFAFEQHRVSMKNVLTPKHDFGLSRKPLNLHFKINSPSNSFNDKRNDESQIHDKQLHDEKNSNSFCDDLMNNSLSPHEENTSNSPAIENSSEVKDLDSNLPFHNINSHLSSHKDKTMGEKVAEKEESTSTSTFNKRETLNKSSFPNNKPIGLINSTIRGKRSFSTYTNHNANIPTLNPDDKLDSSDLNEKKVIPPTNSNSDSKYNLKLSNFLSNVFSILSENKNDLHKAQLIIEKEWIELSLNSIDFKSTIFSKNRDILNIAFNILKLYKENGNLKRSLNFLNDYVVNIDHVFIAFSILLVGYNNSTLTNLYYKMGVAISKHIYIKNFKNKYNNYDDFLEKNEISTNIHFKIGVVFFELFSTHLNPIFQIRQDSEQAFININTLYEKEIRDKLIISPQSLPMVSPPQPWGVRKYGGFLLNNTADYKKGLITGSPYHKHRTRLNNNIYNAINKLNNLKFKVNTDLVNYIQSDEGSFILNHFKKENYDSYLNNIITLDIAKTYMNTPFYLNVNIDWRGRIYTQSFYLDYQGSDFSLALINLYEGKKLDENGKFFFYVYGANLYNENGTNKKRLEERFEWVISNLDKIKNMDEDFILKAESPTNFVAFCLTMRKLCENPDYIVHNPVFLDATCSGVQHFAAMLLDLNLAKHVNLINSSNEGVNDFYSALIPKINKAINDCWVDEMNFKFKDIYLTRDILKKIIMTKSYNVTSYGITEQLKQKLEKVPKTIIYKDKEIVVNDYKVPTIKNEYVILNMYDVEKMANIVNNNIFNQFPILNSIYTYLTRLARIYMKVGIPLSWSTPNGLELTQGYSSSKIEKLKINFLGKNKTLVLRKWSDNKDTVTEVQAIIPNIIHSLDASHLTSVINSWDKYILPIHDCFGTHPNDMVYLAEIVRVTFVSLYSSGDFLKKIDKKLKQNLKDYKVNVIIKDDVEVVEIPINKKRNMYLPLPFLVPLGELNINDVLTKGKNMIT